MPSNNYVTLNLIVPLLSDYLGAALTMTTLMFLYILFKHLILCNDMFN